MPKVSKDSEYYSFVQCGLREYEAKLYVSLFKSDSATANALSNITGIAPGKTYEALSSLEEKGLVVHSKSTPRWYRAVSVNAFIAWLKAEQYKQLSLIQDTLAEMEKRYKPFNLRENITEFYSRESIDLQVILSCKHAEKHVIVYCNSQATLNEYESYLLEINKDIDTYIITDFPDITGDSHLPCYRNTDPNVSLMFTKEIKPHNVTYYPWLQILIDYDSWIQIWYNDEFYVGFLTSRNPQQHFIVQHILEHIEPIH